MRSTILCVASVASLSAPSAMAATTVVETFESFAVGAVISTELPGAVLSASDGGNARIGSASFPVIPGEPQLLYNDAAVNGLSFRADLVVDFLATATEVGAIIDFGVFGPLSLTAYDGAGGTGSVVASAVTSVEGVLSVSGSGIRSAVFAGNGSLTYGIDNLTYTTDLAAIPVPASAWLLLGALAGAGAVRARKAA